MRETNIDRETGRENERNRNRERDRQKQTENQRERLGGDKRTGRKIENEYIKLYIIGYITIFQKNDLNISG